MPEHDDQPGVRPASTYRLSAVTDAFGERVEVTIELVDGGWRETVTVDRALGSVTELGVASALEMARRLPITLSQAATVRWPLGEPA